jgi:hypothetical protein
MKPLSLSACLAMAATAAAAELKEPSQVASDWNKTIAAARQPVLSDGPLGLSATAPGPLTFHAGAEPRPLRSPRPRRNGDVLEMPPNLQMDPGIQKIIPGGETPPPGAKPWYYRGQKIWLIPISKPDVDPASPVGPLLDAPNYRVPQVLPDHQPPGTKPQP